MPHRIQRKRTKGWRMPENTVYVGRPSVFGNPFPVGFGRSREFVLMQYKRWLAGESGTGGGGIRRLTVIARLKELRGKDLACWCPLDEPCHADVLLELANYATPPGKD